jgi:hypothetical protein
MRRAVRRAKQVSFRRQRVVVEVPPEESAATEARDDEDDDEKIEVHVHVHRPSKKARSGPPPRPVLTGVLFDWEWYRDHLLNRPRSPAGRRWSLTTRCEVCDAPLRSTARQCPRCAAPRPRRHFLPALVGMLGLGCIAAVFAVCHHVLGDSVPEHQAPAPAGQYSDTDVVIVGVPVGPSPFAAPASASAETPTPFNYGAANSVLDDGTGR